MISPEQSYPTGPVPPHTYGFPSWVTAYKIAAATTHLLRIKSCSHRQDPRRRCRAALRHSAALFAFSVLYNVVRFLYGSDDGQ
jgi:hypothetical protein